MFYFINGSEIIISQNSVKENLNEQEEIVLEIYGEKIPIPRSYINCILEDKLVDVDNQLVEQIFFIMTKKFREKTGINLSIGLLIFINCNEESFEFCLCEDSKIEPELYKKYEGKLVYAPFFITIYTNNFWPCYGDKKYLIERFINMESDHPEHIIFVPIKYIPKNK